VRVWRIASAAHAAFDGEGARRYGSRWTRKGLPVVFASATLSLAALEAFVHTDPDLQPIDLVAIAVDIDGRVGIDTIEIGDLPDDWRSYPAAPELAAIGEEWLRAARTAVLSVPSVVIPHERNFILNPAHTEFGRLTARRAEPFSFDARMWNKKATRSTHSARSAVTGFTPVARNAGR
jgi:RES domain-containing protein